MVVNASFGDVSIGLGGPFWDEPYEMHDALAATLPLPLEILVASGRERRGRAVSAAGPVQSQRRADRLSPIHGCRGALPARFRGPSDRLRKHASRSGSGDQGRRRTDRGPWMAANLEAARHHRSIKVGISIDASAGTELAIPRRPGFDPRLVEPGAVARARRRTSLWTDWPAGRTPLLFPRGSIARSTGRA